MHLASGIQQPINNSRCYEMISSGELFLSLLFDFEKHNRFKKRDQSTPSNFVHSVTL